MSGRRPWRVVLADDAVDLRLLLSLHVGGDERFEVVGEASDGVEALAVVEAQAPDLLLLDLAMPRMDGLEVLQRLQQAGASVTVVVLSGFAAADVRARVLELGARAYVEKGAALATLRDDLAAWLAADEATAR